MVQRCYLCLSSPRLFFPSLLLLFLSFSLSLLLFTSPGTPRQLVQPFTNQPRSPNHRKMMMRQQNHHRDNAQWKEGKRVGEREWAAGKERDERMRAISLFMHFYRIYVHPQGALCLCLGLCLRFCAFLFVVIIQCTFLPHPPPPPPSNVSY